MSSRQHSHTVLSSVRRSRLVPGIRGGVLAPAPRVRCVSTFVNKQCLQNTWVAPRSALPVLPYARGVPLRQMSTLSLQRVITGQRPHSMHRGGLTREPGPCRPPSVLGFLVGATVPSTTPGWHFWRRKNSRWVSHFL